MDLLPAWRTYRAPGITLSGGNLGETLAHTFIHGKLTWVVNVARDGVYELRVRGRGSSTSTPPGCARIDDRERAPCATAPAMTALDHEWWRVATHKLEAGVHHIEFVASDGEGFIDALALAEPGQPTIDPSAATRPSAINEAAGIRTAATTRFPREYLYRGRVEPFVVLRGESPLAEDVTDFVPVAAGAEPTFEVRAAPSETAVIAFAFATRNNDTEVLDEPVRVRASTLTDGTHTISSASVDARVGLWRNERVGLFSLDLPSLALEHALSQRPTPQTLVKDDSNCPLGPEGTCAFDGPIAPLGTQGGWLGGVDARTVVRSGDVRLVWANIRVPTDATPGRYTGTITLQSIVFPSRRTRVSITVDVRPIALAPHPSGINGIFSRTCPHIGGTPVPGCDMPAGPYFLRSPAEMQRDYEDMRAHHFNAASAFASWDGARDLYQSANMGPGVVLFNDVHTRVWVDRFRVAGFSPYEWICDEATGCLPACASTGSCATDCSSPSAASALACIKLAEVARNGGLSAMTINTPAQWMFFRADVNVPIMAATMQDVFPHAPVAAGPRPDTYLPLAYWTAEVSYPTYHRMMAGPYPRSLGYRGIMPNAYWQVENSHFTYPDQQMRPIPTRSWESMRIGLDDLRHLEAARRVIACYDAERLRPIDPRDPIVDLSRRAIERTIDQYPARRMAAYREMLSMDEHTLDDTRAELTDAYERVARALSAACPPR